MLYIPALPQHRSEPSISLQVEFRNRFQQVSRLVAHALAMGEMTGVLISNSHFQGGEFTHKAEIAEKLRGILDDRAESLRLLRVDRIVAQQMVVLFHGGAAAGGVDDDGIDISVEESIDVAPGHLSRRRAFAVVKVERTATDLILGKDNVAAVASQHAHGGFVHVAEEQRHHATVEHRHFCSARADGR